MKLAHDICAFFENSRYNRKSIIAASHINRMAIEKINADGACSTYVSLDVLLKIMCAMKNHRHRPVEPRKQHRHSGATGNLRRPSERRGAKSWRY